MQMPIWRNASKLRNFSCPCPHLATFHSTPTSFAKWKGKFDPEKDEPKHGQEPKNYARYVVRRKHADAKRALNDFLLKGMYSKRSIQDEWATWYGDSKRSTSSKVEDFSDTSYDQGHSNRSGRSRHNRQSNKHIKPTAKNRHKKYNFVSEEDGDSETTFEVNFGDKCYSWSFRTRAGFDFRNSTPGFEWRDNSDYTRNGKGPRAHWGKEQDSSSKKKRSWECESDFEDDDEADDEHNKLRTAPSYSHRITLGLPPTGPLDINEVKTAFRASALKWHPDKHQGPSQVMAGEKFKSCVEAYKSLCAAFKPCMRSKLSH